MAVNKLGSAPQLMAGQGDIIIFSAPSAGYSDSTKIADVLSNGASVGQVVQDSTSWDGEEVSFDQILDEQGDVITSRATEGTHEFSFDIVDLEGNFLKAFLGAVEITPGESDATAVFADGTMTVFGFGHKLPVKVRPIMILNDESTKAIFFPKAKMAGSLSWDDNIWRIHVVVTAEFMDTASLKTCMIFNATKAASYSDKAATVDADGNVGAPATT